MKVWAHPKEVGDPPPFDFEHISESIARDEEWVDSLKAWAKKHGRGPLRGEEVAFPCGDGYARYVVLRNTELIHIPVGDAWQFPYIERMLARDIKANIERRKGLDRLFAR